MANQTVTKRRLSGSTSGRGQKVTGTATGSAITVHTAVAGTNADGPFDEIFLYAYNAHSADVLLTIEWGGTTSPDDHIKITIPFQQGRVLVADGRLLQGGLLLKAFAATANVIIIDGFVNQVSAP